jgi:hypothetical protein
VGGSGASGLCVAIIKHNEQHANHLVLRTCAFLFDAGEPQLHGPIELPQPIFDPEINDPRKFTLVIGDYGVTQC